MGDQRSRYIVEVVGLEQLRQWSAEKATLEKRALAVERALIQTATASQRYDTAVKQAALSTAKLSTEFARTGEIAARTAAAEQRLTLEAERLRQADVRLGLESEKLALSQARFNKEAETGVTRHSALRTAAGATLSVIGNLSAGVVGVGIASAMMSAKIERTFQSVRGNTTLTDKEFAQMRQTVLDLGEKTGTSFETLARGYEHVTNFGFRAAGATTILAEANKAARATGADSADMAQTLAKVMSTYGLSADQAAVTTAKLWYASANADARMQELAQSGGQTFAMAKALGLSFDQAAATLSLFASKGLNLREAVTQLRGDLSKMVNPTAAVRKEIEYLSKASGVDLVHDFGMTGGKVADLSKIFEDLRRVSELTGRPVAELAAKIFPNLRGTIGALIGSSDDGIKGLNERLHDLGDTQKLQSDLSKREADENALLDTQIQKLQRSIEKEFLPIGNKFAGMMKDAIPVIKSVADHVAALMDWFLKLPAPVKEAVTWFGTFKLATMALGNPLSSLVSGIGWVIKLFRAVPAAAAEAEAGIAGVQAAAGGGGFAAGARGLIGRAAGSGFGAAALAVGATAAVTGMMQHEIWKNVQMGAGDYGYTPGPTNIDPRTGQVIQPHAGPPASMARSIFQTYPNFVKGGGGSSPAHPLGDNWVDDAMKAAKKKRGGSGESDEDKAKDAAITKADGIREANKATAGETYGLTHSDAASQIRDAHEKAAEKLANGENPASVAAWLKASTYKIGLNAQVDAIRDFQQNKQLPYEQGRGMNSLDADTRSSAFDAMANYNQARRDDEADYNKQAADERQAKREAQAASRAAADEYQRRYESSFDSNLSEMARANTGTLKDMSTFYPDTVQGKLSTAYWQRSQQQGYIDQLKNIQAGGDLPNSNLLTDELRAAQEKLDELNKTIQELNGKIGADTPGAKRAADMSANAFVERLQAGSAAGATIGKAFGRNGANIGSGIGALADAFGPPGTNKYVSALSGAVGAFQTGQQQGAIGGGISGAASGAGIGAMFGPGGAAIGAAAGGVLGLLGGLFGGHHRPDTTQRDTNPALSNSPGGFDEDAYRFRVTGQLPTAKQLGLNLQNQNQPIQVVVNMDGVKQTITTQLSGATSTASASLQNSFPNLARPM